jgi:hypothetical protein
MLCQRESLAGNTRWNYLLRLASLCVTAVRAFTLIPSLNLNTIVSVPRDSP